MRAAPSARGAALARSLPNSKPSSALSAPSETVKRTVANDPPLWLDAWFACENPQALSVLASMPVAKVNARRVGTVDARTNAWLSSGATAGTLAAARGHAAFIRELARVAGVAHFALCDDDGRAPLHVAAMRGHTSCVNALLDIGCDVDIRDERDGATPAMFSARFERRETLDALLDRGANVKARDDRENAVGGYLAQNAPRMNESLTRVLLIAGPGGTASVKRGEKTYLAKRAALKAQLECLRVEDLMTIAKSWRANARAEWSTTDKAKLVDALLATTP